MKCVSVRFYCFNYLIYTSTYLYKNKYNFSISISCFVLILFLHHLKTPDILYKLGKHFIRNGPIGAKLAQSFLITEN